MKQKVVIIGSTGSIGSQALEVVRRHGGKLEVIALAAGSNADLLLRQAAEFNPRIIALARTDLSLSVPHGCEVLLGEEAVSDLAALPDADHVLIAVSGAAGIGAAWKAVQNGKRIALANKESLVAAGELIMEESRRTGAQIIPVDSEHSAVFQCIRDEGRFVRRLWLTASGGPFRTLEAEKFKSITPDLALQHPNWSMGAKITVDSATMVNKGLEVIEAHHLFGLPFEDIEVVIHPESMIHSMAEFVDGSILAHLGVPDMRIPIQYAFSWPQRWEASAGRLDFHRLKELHFESPDPERFPALKLVVEAGRRGGTMPAAMNAANEVAVAAFLSGRLGFVEIPRIIAQVMTNHQVLPHPSLRQILDADRRAREEAGKTINEKRG